MSKTFKVSAERRAQINAWRKRNKNLIKAAKNAGVTLTQYKRRQVNARKAASKKAAPVAAAA